MPPERREFHRTGTNLASALELRASSDGEIEAWVTGSPADAGAEQIQPWVDAVACAKAGLGRDHSVFAWEAVVGPKPMRKAVAASLDRAIDLGPLVIEPAESVTNEWQLVRGYFPQRHRFLWRPSLVYGESGGYRWEAAAAAGAADLYRACCLLTLVHSAAWVARRMPQQVGMPDLPLDLYRTEGDRGESQTELRPGRTIEPPEWLAGAWGRIDGDPVLEGAIESYQLGMEMLEEHPSQAAVAIVAAIESVGVTLEPPRTCKCCNQNVGYTRAFKRALHKVRPAEDVEDLATLYSARSKTAHEGKVHGYEHGFGAAPEERLIQWSTTARGDFEYRQLRGIADACRDLLVARIAT
jgi:hypothetical protein